MDLQRRQYQLERSSNCLSLKTRSQETGVRSQNEGKKRSQTRFETLFVLAILALSAFILSPDFPDS